MQTFQEFTGLRGEDFLAEIDAEEAKPLTQRGSIERNDSFPSLSGSHLKATQKAQRSLR